MRQQIFKLIFQHDMRLDQLAKRNANKSAEEVEASLADFMKPDPVYSKFYFTGTDLRSEKFGLDQLIHYPEIIEAIEGAFPDQEYYTASGHQADKLEKVIEDLNLGEVVALSGKEEPKTDLSSLHIDVNSNVGHLKFYPLQNLLPDAFRFFSINGKKFRSERHFYFETWTLNKPPHGFEEVFPESVL